jgi:hypothetical protein
MNTCVGSHELQSSVLTLLMLINVKETAYTLIKLVICVWHFCYSELLHAHTICMVWENITPLVVGNLNIFYMKIT